MKPASLFRLTLFAPVLIVMTSASADSATSTTGDASEWSRRLSTEYLTTTDLQVTSASFAVQSSGGWFGHLAASTENSDSSQAAASADTWSASSGSRINANWSVSLGIDKWQGTRSVSQQTIVAIVSYLADNWSLDLSYLQRELRIEGHARNGSIRKHFETFDGGELAYTYYFNDTHSIGLSYTGYQSNPGAVFRALQQRPELVSQLGDHSFGLVAGQSANALSVNYNVDLPKWYFSAQADTADNYFNDDNSTGLSLYAERSVSGNVTVGAEAGVVSSDNSDNSIFFSVAAHLYW